MNNIVQERLRHVLGASLYGLAAAWGFLQVTRGNDGLLYLLFAATISFTMTYWCIVDGRIGGHPILHSLYWLVFIFWPIAVPIYLIWAYKLRGLKVVLIHSIGLYCVCFAAYSVARHLIYGNA